MIQLFRTPLAALLVLLILAPLPASPLAAQQNGPTITVRAGLDGAGFYRVGAWFPIQIIAENQAADISGVFEVRFPGDENPGFRYPVELPRGARKQLNLAVTSTESHRTATLTLVVNGAIVTRQQLSLDPITFDEFLVGVLSSDATMLNSLAALDTLNLTPRISHLSAENLPADPQLLAGFDALVLHDLSTAELARPQLDALAAWTKLGGQLVIGGGPSADQITAGLADLLPADLGPLRADTPTASLERLARRNDLGASVPTLTSNTLTLRPGARARDNANLIAQVERGSGSVILAAFDLGALRSWAGEADLWGELLDVRSRVQIGSSFRMRNETPLRDALLLAALRLPSPLLLLGMIGVYIVIIGPANFLLLRRLGRSDLAWITTPVLVAIFLAGSYGASLALRGTRPQISQLAIVQGVAGQSAGQATAFVSIFSPQRRSYTLAFPAAALVTPGTLESYAFTEQPITVTDQQVSVENMLVDVSALRTLIVEQPGVSMPLVTGDIQRSQSRIEGTVRNQSDQTLRNAMIVSRNSAQLLGDLPPGGEVPATLALSAGNFPDQIPLGTSAIFNYDRVLYSLFGYDRFVNAEADPLGGKGIPDEGIYLLAWADQPAVETQLDGGPSLQKGETLYLIRLDP